VLTDPDARGVRERHWGDLWHAALARLVVAARAHGLRPIDGPFGDIGDEEGYLAAARRAAALGCEGKWAVHPAQIPLANEVFSPPEEQVEEARRILAALEQAAAEGKGAVALDGRLVDAASIRMARGLVAKAERLARARGR
jgi:malyl-CoA/(S)-citramalyl-CoA lyase